ncbi:HlyD family secretion protein [Sphingomonas sp.]|uniref:HlyD family secretion protein n=1 Tax=Sphingomonas sp. TaxID=28214 RepID=UPI003D6D083F
MSGIIALDRGFATIVPSRSGTISALRVREGEVVTAGQPLVEIRSEEDMAKGGTVPGRVAAALETEDSELKAQSKLTLEGAAQEQSRLIAQMQGIHEEISGLDAQIISQRRLIEVAENEFRDVQSVALKGYISKRDVEAREATLIGRRQQLSQLEQTRSVKSADYAQARRTIDATVANARAQVAGLQSSRAQLSQKLAEVATAKGYTINAPIDGAITAMTARLGQPTNQQQTLMIVRPTNAISRAELYAPSQAAGFLAQGQEVRLAVDAFPFQRFGVVTGRIIQISSVAIPRADKAGDTVPVYLVVVSLVNPSVMAFGKRQPLLPGMTVSARIVTQEQSLIEWLFEPIFAVRRR